MTAELLITLAVQAAIGIFSAGLTIYAHRRLVDWRLKGLESRMAKVEGGVSNLQQRVAVLDSRNSQR